MQISKVVQFDRASATASGDKASVLCLKD